MIDLACEQLVALSDVPEHLPRRRGKRVHLSTVYRWVQRGVQGVTLDTIRVGGVTYTSSEALGRFCAELSAAPPTNASAGRAPQERRAQVLRDEQLADERGL